MVEISQTEILFCFYWAPGTFIFNNTQYLAAVQALLEDSESDEDASDVDPNIAIHSDHNTDTDNVTADEQCMLYPCTGGLNTAVPALDCRTRRNSFFTGRFI